MGIVINIILILLLIGSITIDIVCTKLQKKYKDELSRSNKIIIDAMKNYIDIAKEIIENSKDINKDKESSIETFVYDKYIGNKNQLPKIDPKG